MIDELWEKYAIDELMDRDDFLAAITEYGKHIKAEAVKVCRGMVNDDAGNAHNFACEDCAAAIERMEIK